MTQSGWASMLRIRMWSNRTNVVFAPLFYYNKVLPLTKFELYIVNILAKLFGIRGVRKYTWKRSPINYIFNIYTSTELFHLKFFHTKHEVKIAQRKKYWQFLNFEFPFWGKLLFTVVVTPNTAVSVDAFRILLILKYPKSEHIHVLCLFIETWYSRLLGSLLLLLLLLLGISFVFFRDWLRLWGWWCCLLLFLLFLCNE